MGSGRSGSILVLGSGSPRRRELLAQIGLHPDRVVAPSCDESSMPGEMPHGLAKRLAAEKAESVYGLCPGCFVLAADTVVAVGRRVLDKTEDKAVARRYLDLLSGRRHRVYGGIAVFAPDGRRSVQTAMTVVEFKRLDAAAADAYLATDEWRGKAGAYAIQGRAEAFITRINGSYSNVVGLALPVVYDMLIGLGYRC